MIDDDVITRLVELHNHIQAPAAPPEADASRGKRLLRRRRTVRVGAGAAAVVAVLAIVAVTTGGPQADNDIDPVRPGLTRGATPTPTESPWMDDEYPLERIRAEGRVDEEQVTKSGITWRKYVLCDGSPECSPNTDGPIRREHEHYALEVTQGARSALFGIVDSVMTAVAAYDDDTLLVMDPLPEGNDPLDPYQNSYRLVRADGTEIHLEMSPDPAPAVPGPGVVLINHFDLNPDDDSTSSQIVLVVDENEVTVRVLEMPQNIPASRTWGPNLDEFLWFVTDYCDLHFWTSNGTFETRSAGCTDGFEPGTRDITWVNGDWFPDGWLEPGRMAFLERNLLGSHDVRFTLHVTLDHGTTWQRIPVSSEATVPEALRQAG